MLKKIFTSLFLVIYISVSTVSFADEVVVEVLSETPAPVVEAAPESVPEMVAPIVENIPEEIFPVVEETPPVSEEALPSQEVQVENVAESTAVEDSIDLLNVAPEETIEITEEPPTTEEPPITVLVEVEENSVFTPPGPEPEPWQPAVLVDPTTDDTPVGDTETHSDPVFLAENSVSVRRMIEKVVVDPAAKHSCKVDIFRTDISDTAASTLSVKFYGISTLAAYDAEIGSLPNGIDVRFAKNNDYIYDFRGKETTLELVVNNQDGSLTGNFTIPIIYTHKGKKESSVICQLNIINEEEEVIPAPVVAPIVEPIEPVVDPTQEFVEEILEIIAPKPVVEPIDEILDILVPEIPPVSPPVELPPVVVPEPEKSPIEPPPDNTPPEPVNDPVVPAIVEPEVIAPAVESLIVPELVPEIVTPVVENSPIVESTPILSPDVSST